MTLTRVSFVWLVWLASGDCQVCFVLLALGVAPLKSGDFQDAAVVYPDDAESFWPGYVQTKPGHFQMKPGYSSNVLVILSDRLLLCAVRLWAFLSAAGKLMKVASSKGWEPPECECREALEAEPSKRPKKTTVIPSQGLSNPGKRYMPHHWVAAVVPDLDAAPSAHCLDFDYEACTAFRVPNLFKPEPRTVLEESLSAHV